MVYNPAIPQPTDLISNSQGAILGNFAAIGTSFNFSSGGFNQVTFTGASTPLTPGGTTSVDYTKLGTSSSTLFNGLPVPYFINALGSYPLMPDVTTSGSDSSFQIGALIVNLGQGNIVNGSQSTTVTWSKPFTTTIYTIQMTKNGNGLGSSGNTLTCNATATSLTQGTFTAQSTVTSGHMPFYYLAIGY